MADQDERDPGHVRPYAVTGGRTRPTRADLPIETLVVITPAGAAAAPGLVLEQRSIALRCQEPVSVAELSAYLDIPFGVARVLVADMVDDGLVTVHQPLASPNLALLQRVLQGLHAL
jgi:Protein of unknown function (DUF742)